MRRKIKTYGLSTTVFNKEVIKKTIFAANLSFRPVRSPRRLARGENLSGFQKDSRPPESFRDCGNDKYEASLLTFFVLTGRGQTPSAFCKVPDQQPDKVPRAREGTPH